MKLNPTCNKCGQSDEFFVSKDNVYICICGHECTEINEIDDNEVLQPASIHYHNLQKPTYIH